MRQGELSIELCTKIDIIMTRKSKQPGGINPLTYHEKSRLNQYGTTTKRLNTENQRKFGDCCLGLEPADNPVATPRYVSSPRDNYTSIKAYKSEILIIIMIIIILTLFLNTLYF